MMPRNGMYTQNLVVNMFGFSSKLCSESGEWVHGTRSKGRENNVVVHMTEYCTLVHVQCTILTHTSRHSSLLKRCKCTL